jgi:protocatechuate 3,4-dioxygenase beta subunit
MISAAPLVGCTDESTGPAASSEASLAALALTGATLTPPFAAETAAYSGSVPNATSSVTITATATDSNATVALGGGTPTPGGATSQVALVVGVTTIPIIVTAEEGTTRTYTVAVTRAGGATTACVLIPQETIGPYPLLQVLSNTALRRADVRENRIGVTLTLVMSLVDVNDGCNPVTNAAVYIWQCDKDGNYSGYGSEAEQTYLRGIQFTDANGQVTFTTVYPGWYPGRITHIHFQVYLNADLGGTATATSQIAFSPAITQTAYASAPYAARGQNTSVASFAQDMVFADGTTYQLANVAGDVASGYVATLTVGVAA